MDKNECNGDHILPSAPPEVYPGTGCLNRSNQGGPNGGQLGQISMNHQENNIPGACHGLPPFTLSYQQPGFIQQNIGPGVLPTGPPPPYYLPPEMPYQGGIYPNPARQLPYFVHSGPAAQVAHPQGTYPRQIMTSPPPPPPYFHSSEVPTSLGTTSQTAPSLILNNPIVISSREMRLSFLRKVYILLLLELMLINGFVCLFLFWTRARRYFRIHFEITIAASVAEVILLLLLVGLRKVRRPSPANYALLFLSSLYLAFLIGILATFTHGHEVLLGTALTSITTVSLFLYSDQKGFTTYRGVLCAVLPVLIGCAVYYAIYQQQVVHTVIAGSGALIITLFIYWDMLQMIKGTHRQLPLQKDSLCAVSLVLQKFVFIICVLICISFRFI